MGGHDPYSSSKGARGARRRRLPALVLRAADAPVAPPARAGQRDRRRRLGRGPADPGHHARRQRGRADPDPQPDAVRPWQHVLEPAVAATCCSPSALWDDAGVAEGWNFGPAPRTPGRCAGSPTASPSCGPTSCAGSVDPGPHPHEAGYLALDSTKARERLGWAPAWDLDERSSGSSSGTSRIARAAICAPSRSRRSRLTGSRHALDLLAVGSDRVAGVGGHAVAARSARDRVVAVRAIRDVDRVVAGATADLVRACPCVDRVVAVPAADVVCTGAAGDVVVAVTTEDGVATGAAIDLVVAGAAVDLVVAGPAVDVVVATARGARAVRGVRRAGWAAPSP